MQKQQHQQDTAPGPDWEKDVKDFDLYLLTMSI